MEASTRAIFTLNRALLDTCDHQLYADRGREPGPRLIDLSEGSVEMRVAC